MEKKMEKIVYITGCLGFIGSYITRTCLEEGWYVRGVDKVTYVANPYLLEEFKKYENFFFERKDINDLDQLYDCDYVINTAAENYIDNPIVQNNNFFSSNINGVYNLLELIRNNKHYEIPVLVHFSTHEVYGGVIKEPHKESDLLNPSNPFSATKAAGDLLILAWAKTYKIPYIIVRPTNNYGIGQYVEKFIPKICKFLRLGRKIPMHEHGGPVRNWLHASDIARAIITIIKSDVRNEIYNISSKVEQKNIDTLKKVINFYYPGEDDVNKYIDFSWTKIGKDERISIDDSKLKKLGWKEECVFDEELKTIVEYYKNKFIW
jgi:dTDP-glucose 4,6-dehydratase